jgi:hypothetical protein
MVPVQEKIKLIQPTADFRASFILKLTLEKARALHLGLDIAGKKCSRQSI